MDEMIVHNLMGQQTLEDTQLLIQYVKYVLSIVPVRIHRAKVWHDHLFRPRYYYTRCPRTLDLLQSVRVDEMARHVFLLEGASVPITVAYLMDVESVVRRIMYAGYCMVWVKGDAMQVTTDPSVVFKGGRLEVVLEGQPFEQEYVSDLKAFGVWLDTRLSLPSLVK